MQAVAATTSAVQRMTELLSAKDKKQKILDMAAANEIDQALMDLLQQNIEAARGAGQDDAANFMEKVRIAAGKYLVAVPGAPTAAMPSPPATLGGVTVPTSASPLAGMAAPSPPSPPSAPSPPSKLVL